MPEQLLEQLNRADKMRHRLRKIIISLSFAVIMLVFWGLKLTGIGIAGEAFCGRPEHIHTEECLVQMPPGTPDEAGGYACELEEHIHVESCYSDITADLETQEDWERSLSEVEEERPTAEKLVSVARSQLGYKESILNFEVDLHGVRRGITRYGQWYGNPYGDWSAMFVSFCVHYAGATELPANAGPESMRLEWEKEGLYAS